MKCVLSIHSLIPRRWLLPLLADAEEVLLDSLFLDLITRGGPCLAGLFEYWSIQNGITLMAIKLLVGVAASQSVGLTIRRE